MSSDQWTSSDIFRCQKCGDCCKGYGGTFIDEADIERIAAFIKTDPKTFVERYCQLSGGKPVLSQKKDGYCIFWERECTIHPVKPMMCRRWPFIESVLIDIDNWHIMGAMCPGIRTDVSDSIIRSCVEQELSRTRSD